MMAADPVPTSPSFRLAPRTSPMPRRESVIESDGWVCTADLQAQAWAGQCGILIEFAGLAYLVGGMALALHHHQPGCILLHPAAPTPAASTGLVSSVVLRQLMNASGKHHGHVLEGSRQGRFHTHIMGSNWLIVLLQWEGERAPRSYPN